MTDEPGDSFWKVFNRFEDEGMADLIDKGDHPERMYERYGKSFEELYLDEYQHASVTLQRLDSLLAGYLAAPVAGEYAPVAELLVLTSSTSNATRLSSSELGWLSLLCRFNGHPTGYYMTGLIREEGLEKELIRVFDSPVAFVRLYNDAARRRKARGGTEYILSKELLRHLEDVEKGR